MLEKEINFTVTVLSLNVGQSAAKITQANGIWRKKQNQTHSSFKHDHANISNRQQARKLRCSLQVKTMLLSDDNSEVKSHWTQGWTTSICCFTLCSSGLAVSSMYGMTPSSPGNPNLTARATACCLGEGRLGLSRTWRGFGDSLKTRSFRVR